MIRLGLLLWLSVASFSISENRGVSHLGFCHKNYDCELFMESFKGSPVIRTGWLDNTFNPEGCKCLPKLQTTKKGVEVRVHIVNGPGLRNRRLERHEIHWGRSIAGLERDVLRGNMSFLARFDKRAEIVRNQLDSIIMLEKCYVSPVLESDFGRQARLKLLRRTRKLFPKCHIVDNPLKAPCISGFICEKHGDFVPPQRPYIADLDGLDLYETYGTYYAQVHENALINFGWKYCNNLNVKGEKFVPPTKRKKSCDSTRTKQLNDFVIKGKGR